MKISPNKLVAILDQISMGGLIDPVRIVFDENEASVSQLDLTRTLGIIAKIGKVQFKDYQPVGPVTFNSEIIKRLSKFFQTDEVVELAFNADKVKVTGSVETFEANLPTETVPELKTEINETEYGSLLAKAGIRSAFFIDMSEIKSDYGDRRKLVYSSNGLQMQIHEDVFRYERQIRALKKNVIKEGEVVLDAKILNEVCSLCKGPAWVVFSEGPVEICYKEVGLQVTYIISPLTE
ncbi:MAG: hypothetical protein QW764_02960 [Desulfurococcaceae archaeon]